MAETEEASYTGHINQIGQAVSWLDEQRRLDRDTIEKLQQRVERFELQLKDVLPQLDRLDGEARQAAAVRARLTRVEEQMRLIQEQTVDLSERTHDQAQALDKALLKQQSDLEREHKIVAESSIQVSELFRREDTLRAQITTVTDETKRFAGIVAGLGLRVEHIEQEIERVNQRMLGTEDLRKRLEPELQALHRNQDTVQSDFARVQQMQQAADLRWNREISEWQQRMEEWARVIEDQGKALQQLVRELTIAKANIDQMEEQVSEQAERMEAALVDVRRLENTQEMDRQETSRFAASLDALRRRIDDQAGQIRQLEERGTTFSGDIRDAQARTDEIRKRAEETLARLIQVEQRQRERAEEITTVNGVIASLKYEMEAQIHRLDEILQQQRQWIQDQFAQRQRLEERQVRRRLAEMEQQLREVREQYPRIADGASEA